MLSNMVCSFIKQASQGRQGRIETTLAKAKAARVVAEKMVSLGKKGQDKNKTVHYRRLAASRLRAPSRTQFDKEGKVKGKQRREAWRESEDVVHILFDDIAPRFKDRPGGYTRIIKLGRRKGDAAEMAILEWVESEMAAVNETAAAPAETQAEPAKKGETAAKDKADEKSETETAEDEATEDEASTDTDEEKSEDTESAEEEKSEEKADSEEPSEETEDAPPAEPETESPDEEVSAEGEDAAKPEDGDKKKQE
jgi:large subunit ribosomal protein L17